MPGFYCSVAPDGLTSIAVASGDCTLRAPPLRDSVLNAYLVAFVEERLLSKPTPPKPKNPPKGGFLILVGPGGFEPPTSTMSRPIGRTKTRVDASEPNAANISCQSTPISEQIPKTPSRFSAMSARCLRHYPRIRKGYNVSFLSSAHLMQRFMSPARGGVPKI